MKIFIFCLKIFFRTSLKNFSWVQHGCSRYLEGVFYLQVYVEKRMKVIQHIDQNIFGKNYPPQNWFWGGWQSQWIFNLIWRDVIAIFFHTQIIPEKLTDFFLVYILNKTSYNNGRHGILKLKCHTFQRSTLGQHGLTYEGNELWWYYRIITSIYDIIGQHMLTKCWPSVNLWKVWHLL